MNVIAKRIRPNHRKSLPRKWKSPRLFFLLFFVLCGILLVRYGKVSNSPRAALEYTVDGDSIIIHNEPLLPPNDKLAEHYWEILKRTVNNDNDDGGDRRWVYELEVLGGYEYRNLRKLPPLLQLDFGETYKYGVAKDRGTFDVSMDIRYPNNQMYLYVNLPEFIKAESLRTYFLPIRKHPTTLPYKQAELLERILRFNYYIKNQKLPPGSAKF